ncbi:MAG TPA: hypothetical protein VN721_02775, partial [Flavipsychrobacter sp.]|nr:hypothetical protein [Flavipsychrobacter sp.]
MKKIYPIKFLSVCFLFLSFAANAQYVIKTIAGNGIAADSGDGGAAINCELHFPMQVCTDAIGNIYIVEQINNTIRKIDASTG